jgi:hypothetical protein
MSLCDCIDEAINLTLKLADSLFQSRPPKVTFRTEAVSLRVVCRTYSAITKSRSCDNLISPIIARTCEARYDAIGA